MRFKKSGGKIYDVELTTNELRALNATASRALAEHTRKHELEIEALVIRQLRRCAGWGEVRLRRFYDGFANDIMSLIATYEMSEADAPWLCIEELKKEGFDIEQWHREKFPNEQYDVKMK